MQTLFTMHAVDPAKLDVVKTEMRAMGAPTLRVVDCGDYYMALEGVHRFAAAAELAIAPELIVLDQDELVEADSLDWQNLQRGEQYTAGELAGEAYSPSCGVYQLDHDGRVRAARA
jgi:hypothetical protein